MKYFIIICSMLYIVVVLACNKAMKDDGSLQYHISKRGELTYHHSDTVKVKKYSWSEYKELQFESYLDTNGAMQCFLKHNNSDDTLIWLSSTSKWVYDLWESRSN